MEWIDIFIRILIGILGISAYAFFTARDQSELTINSVLEYFKKQSVRWGISLAIIVLLSVYLHFVPEGGSAFESATGFAITTELASFATLGWFLCSASKKIQNKTQIRE